MIEKRFTMSDDGSGLWSIYDNGKWLSAKDIVKQLNDFNKENEDLKQALIRCAFDGD